jgi:hypothetical protein
MLWTTLCFVSDAFVVFVVATYGIPEFLWLHGVSYLESGALHYSGGPWILL